MSAPPVPDSAATRPQDVLDTAIGTARAGGRLDLVDRLSAARSLLRAPSVTVQVAGGAPQGRTDMVTALLRAVPGSPGITLTQAGVAGPGEAADIVVFVADSAQILTTAELDQLRALHHRCPAVVFVLTGIDRHPHWRDVFEADLDLLGSAGVPAAPFAVSVALHTEAVATARPALATASGIPALAERLRDLAGQTELSAARAVAQEVLGAVGELEDPGTAPPGPVARRPRATEPAPAAPDRGRWQQVLSDGFAAVSSDVDFDLRTRVRLTVAEAERVVDENDPATSWDAVEAWLRERLDYEGRRTRALLTARTAEVASALAADLGGAPLRPVHPPEVPDLFDHLPPREPPTGRRRPLAARGRSLVMSGYGGLMMALVLPRFAGIDLPVWIVVGGALLAAVLMGGAALSGERKRQLDARRARAKALVRHCADGFLLGAGKYTRDTIRAAQQQLRDKCAARTAERQRALPPARSGRPTRPPTTAQAELAALRRRALTLLTRPAL
ncbi:hypothetical protein [Pseudonocardia xinjiangensis]|uniref:hypothetical protein n=1 Tax=Pseudonocardia xinjiangensis TaxID=75289 RepID=UPI0031D4C5E2